MPMGSVMTATITGNPDTSGTFTQPVPYSDGQAGHFAQTGGLGTNATGGPVGVGDGWYSYDLGSWHLISLNIECETQPGGCSNSGAWFAAELEWLKKDLEANHSVCTLAYWHQPVFSATNSIAVPEGPTAVAFWQLLYQHHADLVLNGHDHLYARYRPLDPSRSLPIPRKGIREFIVGTGGETLDPIVTTDTTAADPTGNPNFNARENLEAGTRGILGRDGPDALPNGYAWDFESALKDPAQTTGPAGRSTTRASAAATVQPTGSDRIVIATLGLKLLQYASPFRQEIVKGDFFCAVGAYFGADVESGPSPSVAFSDSVSASCSCL